MQEINVQQAYDTLKQKIFAKQFHIEVFEDDGSVSIIRFVPGNIGPRFENITVTEYVELDFINGDYFQC